MHRDPFHSKCRPSVVSPFLPRPEECLPFLLKIYERNRFSNFTPIATHSETALFAQFSAEEIAARLRDGVIERDGRIVARRARLTPPITAALTDLSPAA